VHTPSIYGHGYPDPPDGVTIEREAMSIVDYLHSNQLYDLTVVGHNIGGVVCQRVAELCTELISQVIFFDAFLLQGDSVIDIAAAGGASLLWAAYQSDVVGGNVLLPYETFASYYIQDADERLARGVYSYLTPEPWGPLNERQAFPKFWDLVTAPVDPYYPAALHLKTAYIVSPLDISLGRADIWQEQRERLGPTCRPITLAKGSHEAMFTAPSQLAEAILIAADAPMRP
jgi:pimeloyl-ACP methyl ester carboxylesterase